MTRGQRFWARVTVGDGCWIHGGAIGSHGYPQFCGGTAHRWSWALNVGPIPLGVFVLHSCNNKKCVRPDHLRLGSHQDNMDDIGRVGHPSRGVTRAEAEKIRASAEPQRNLAKKYGISQRAVFNIKSGKTYKF